MRYTARSANTQPIRRIHQNLNEMKILIVASDKGGRFSPFVEEQKDALIKAGLIVASYAHTAHGIKNYIREIKHLRRYIMNEHPDVIHAHFGLTGLMATIAVIGLYVPVVVTYHGCDINATKNRPLSRIAMRLSAWNIFVSHRQIVTAYGTERKIKSNNNWSIIPCGLDINTFNPAHVNDDWFDSKFVSKSYVLFAGRYADMVKNAALAKRVIDVYNEIHPEHLVEMIELCGYSRSEVVTLMSRCNTLLLTSIREGSPQVIKEAMACGCPIVSVDVGDVAERVSGVEGCWIASSSDPQELAKLLECSLAFGRTAGRDKLLRDGLDNVQIAEKLIDIYKKVKK